MNLSNIFKPTLNDLKWLEEGETFKPSGKDNNIKDDLYTIWNMNPVGDIGELNNNTIPLNPNPMPKPILLTLSACMQKGREAMNKGFSIKQIKATLDKSDVDKKVASEAISKLAKLEGVVGKFAIDVRGYKNPKDALKHASASPYVKHIKYVIGYKGDLEYITKVPNTLYASAAENKKEYKLKAIDSFLDDNKYTEEKTKYAKELMMPILAEDFDLDPSFADDTLLELANTKELDKNDIKNLKANHKTAYSQLKNAFLMIDKKKIAAKASQYKEVVSSNKFMMKAADNKVEFQKPVEASLEFKAVPLPKLNEFDIQNPNVADIALPEGKGPDIEQINRPPQELEIEEGQYFEPELVGSDIIDIDDVKSVEQPLEIDDKFDLFV